MNIKKINESLRNIHRILSEDVSKDLIKMLQRNLIDQIKSGEEIISDIDLDVDVDVDVDGGINKLDVSVGKGETFEIVGEIFHDEIIDYAKGVNMDPKVVMTNLKADKRAMDQIISVLSKHPIEWRQDVEWTYGYGGNDADNPMHEEEMEENIQFMIIPKRFKYNQKKDIVEIANGKLVGWGY